MWNRLQYIFVGLFFVGAYSGNQDETKKTFEELLSVICDHDKTLQLNTSGIKIRFYDFEANRNEEYDIGKALQTIAAQHLNFTKNLIFYVPGYKSDMNSSAVTWIMEEFEKNPDVYLIIVDYTAYTTWADPIPVKTYKLSVLYAYYIGRSVGLLLSGLRGKGFSSENIHGIGHSFGAQLLGYIGETYLNNTSEMIGRLTALDPASVCFSSGPVEEQIRSGVAKYVEVYHCNSGYYGTTRLLADADFFFGNGRTQSQCASKVGYTDEEVESCSHTSCVRYWTKTINDVGYMAKACNSYEALKEGACADKNSTVAGYGSNGNSTGVFYISEELYDMIELNFPV